MNAEEAAAKADALIARHRATRRPQRNVWVEHATKRAAITNPIMQAILVVALGVASGLAVPKHPVLCVIAGIVAALLALRMARIAVALEKRTHGSQAPATDFARTADEAVDAR